VLAKYFYHRAFIYLFWNTDVLQCIEWEVLKNKPCWKMTLLEWDKTKNLFFLQKTHFSSSQRQRFKYSQSLSFRNVVITCIVCVLSLNRGNPHLFQCYWVPELDWILHWLRKMTDNRVRTRELLRSLLVLLYSRNCGFKLTLSITEEQICRNIKGKQVDF
jgi:hypothetical protein